MRNTRKEEWIKIPEILEYLPTGIDSQQILWKTTRHSLLSGNLVVGRESDRVEPELDPSRTWMTDNQKI